MKNIDLGDAVVASGRSQAGCRKTRRAPHRSVLKALSLMLVGGAFLFGGQVSAGEVLWSQSNMFGSATLTQLGYGANMQTNFVPTNGNALTVTTIGNTTNITDGTDTVSITLLVTGAKVTRSKAGYYGTQLTVYDNNGSVVQSSDTLMIPVSSGFADSFGSWFDFEGAATLPDPPPPSPWNPGGPPGGEVIINSNISQGCRDQMLYSGIGIVGSSMLIGAGFLALPAFGLGAGAILTGIAAARSFATAVMSSCAEDLRRRK